MTAPAWRFDSMASWFAVGSAVFQAPDTLVISGASLHTGIECRLLAGLDIVRSTSFCSFLKFFYMAG